jgi:iron complex outermembrane receptor protein
VFREDGEQRSRGFELETFGEPLAGLRLLGGLALLDAELRETEGGGLNDGNGVPGSPDYVVKLGAEWDTPVVNGLTLVGHVIRAGEQKGNNANTVELGAWTRLDLGARYAVAEGLTLRARVENVLDEEYWETAEAFDGNYSLGAPRTFILSGTVSF